MTPLFLFPRAGRNSIGDLRHEVPIYVRPRRAVQKTVVNTLANDTAPTNNSSREEEEDRTAGNNHPTTETSKESEWTKMGFREQGDNSLVPRKL